MMNWKAKDIFKFLGIVTLFLLFLGFLYQILGVIAWVAAALLITILLSPLVDWFQRLTPKKHRGTAVLLTLIFVLLILVFVSLVIFPPLAKEVAAMIGSLSEYAKNVQATPQYNELYSQIGSVGVSPSQLNVANIAKEVTSIIGKGLSGLISGISGGIFVLITITTLTFFMLLDTGAMLKEVSKYIPVKYHGLYEKLTKDLFSIVSKYFSGVVIIATIAGVAALLPLYLTKAPYIMALALTIAIFDLIPMVGATIGTIIVVLVCLLSGNIVAAAGITAFIVVYQQIENNVITPLVQKQTVKMSALAILIALLIGGAIGGIIGTLLAIPAAAFIKVVYDALKEEKLIMAKGTEV
jgi:predicted PurR-regulated permease PerM